MTFPLNGARAARFDAMLAPVAAACIGARPGRALLTDRAVAMGFAPPGLASANGSCRLIRVREGCVALNLARTEDMTLVPALIGRAVEGCPWRAVETSGIDAATLVERATLLGLPLALLGETTRPAAIVSDETDGVARTTPRILDLSVLWAGPLCAALLQRTGAVVKRIENSRRPDRSEGPGAAFFAALNAGKTGITLDLPHERDRLIDAIVGADIVIESSRPRAMAALGIDPAALVAARPGLIWVAITAHGRAGDATRVGFGDDAAVAGGLVDHDNSGTPMFAGDAIADPLGGIAAARAVLELRAKGSGGLIDVALAGAAAEIAGR